MDFFALSGTLGTCLSTIILIPQIIKTYRSGSAKDISVISIICFFFAAIFWTIYGIGLGSKPLMITNTFQFIFSVILLLLKYRSKK